MSKHNKKLNNKSGFSGKLRIRKYKNGKCIHDQTEHNLVVSGSGGYGRNLVIRQLANDTTYGIAITQAKIGTGTTAPVDGDTDLETTVLSNISVADEQVSNDSVVFQFFIPDGDLADGTYTEFGMFIGSRLFSRALFSSSYSKSSGEDTRIDYTITLTAS